MELVSRMMDGSISYDQGSTGTCFARGHRQGGDKIERLREAGCLRNAASGTPEHRQDRTVLMPGRHPAYSAILAMLRSCRWLHSSNIRTSLSRSILSPSLTVALAKQVPVELGIIGDRSVHHPADEFHRDPPVRFAHASRALA